eukprot:114424-Hanusia_phi.AAC.2
MFDHSRNSKHICPTGTCAAIFPHSYDCLFYLDHRPNSELLLDRMESEDCAQAAEGSPQVQGLLAVQLS